MEVPLDLLRSQGALAHGLLHQVAVVTAVGGHLILGPWGDRRTLQKDVPQTRLGRVEKDGPPEKSSHSSPLRSSGIPFRTSSLLLEVRYMQTPRPNSEKWMFHASTFIFSFICRRTGCVSTHS